MRFRLYPTPEQEVALLNHCAHARYVWNLGLEQRLMWTRDRGPTPGYNEQSRQLTEARGEYGWLKAGSFVVQQHALRDLDQAFRYWWNGTHGKPRWHKKEGHEGFRVTGLSNRRWERVTRKRARVLVPKVGWVEWRWTRHPGTPKSYRIKRDASGQWWLVFAVVPEPIPGPSDGSVVGVDRGVTISLALSDGTTFQAPVDRDVKRLQRRLARCKRGSNRRRRVKARLARAHGRNANRRKDWVEKTTTTIARRYDTIVLEDLKIRNMTKSAKGTIENPGRNVGQKAGLNRAILASGWGEVDRRLNDKAAGRVVKVNPAYTSQQCNACGHIASESRESQARFRCVACGYACNADLNAAKNIAARSAVTARGGTRSVPAKRESSRRRKTVDGVATHGVSCLA